MNLIALLQTLFIGLGTTLPGKILTALGFGFVASAGLTALVDSLISTVNGQFNSMPSDILQIAQMAGFIKGIGYLTAAFATKAVYASLPQLSKLPS